MLTQPSPSKNPAAYSADNISTFQTADVARLLPDCLIVVVAHPRRVADSRLRRVRQRVGARPVRGWHLWAQRVPDPDLV